MNATISAGEWFYMLTENDKLWAARMCQREGGDPADVLWTMTQRFAQVHRTYPTFAEMIQNYSQAINPKWRREGLYCRPGGSHATDDSCGPGPVGACCESLLVRRAAAAVMPFSATSQAVQAAVNAWFNGTLPNPVPKAVEFADQRVGHNFVNNPRNAGSVIVKDAGNVYIATAASLRWPPNFVTMTGTLELSPVSGGGGSGGLIGVMVGILGASWIVWRLGR